jgi:SAM-dependent methyltransferase
VSPAEANRAYWDRCSREYQARHAVQLNVDEPVWGTWSIPERELDVLGDVRDKDVLELGCGAARWSILLTRRGARPVGLDNSGRQLEHARRLMADAGVEFPLVHAAAEDMPLPDEAFDVVFSDHGAISWADPYRVVPEVARVLRPGGLLAFNVTTPLVAMCWNDAVDRLDARLHRPYFGIHRIEEGDGAATFQLPYGEWIRLLRAAGFAVEELIELRPEQDATTTYDDFVPLDWARRWPGENVWKARKA